MPEVDDTDQIRFPSGYALNDAARLLGLTAGQIRAFVQEGLLDPRRGSRGEYRFSFQDLVLLRSAKELSEHLSPRKLRRALRSLREQLPRGRALTSLRITSEGDRVLARDGDASWEPESGQTLLNFQVAELATVVEPLVRRAAEDARNAGEDLTAEDWYELGCDLESCDLAQARDAYRRALELEPLHPDAHVNLGRILHEAGELRAAEGHYRLARQGRARDATAAFDLGVCLQDLGRLAEAINAYADAIEIDPGYADAHYNIASLYEKFGQKQRALRHLQLYRKLAGDG